MWSILNSKCKKVILAKSPRVVDPGLRRAAGRRSRASVRSCPTQHHVIIHHTTRHVTLVSQPGPASSEETPHLSLNYFPLKTSEPFNALIVVFLTLSHNLIVWSMLTYK